MGKAIKRLTVFALMAVLIFLIIFSLPETATDVFADTEKSVQAVYESTNVLNNLNGATIGGKEFDLADYPHNDNGKPQIISFVEFCYSYYAKKQEDFGLYVYIYNPQDVVFDMSGERNTIQLTYGNVQSYSKYVLEFLNYSAEAGYEGRFWKFKIRLTDEQKSAILSEVSENSRVYKVSGVELAIKGNTTEYPCLQTYTYKGYALGYGSELAQSDTLSCTVDGFDKYLSLDVHSTFFRGRGTNGKKYIQDTLHSVYFSVPNSIIEEYGRMTAVHATWLNAYTAPALVTGNSEFYEAMLDHIGQEIGVPDTYENLSFLQSFRTEEDLSDTWIGGQHFSGYYYGYNYPSKLSSSIVNNITNLHWIFKAENGNADTYDVPSEDILGYMSRYTSQHRGELVNNKYSRALFEKADSAFTDINITADETYSLTSEIIMQSWWEKLFGSSHVEEIEDFNNIKAIEAVDYDDISSLESVQVCNKYYIDDSDYNEFSDFCTISKRKNETVYLFRYKQSEYFSAEVYEGTWKRTWSLTEGGFAGTIAPGYVYFYENDDTNAFIMQQWVQLDFDIIDLTFTKDGVDTIIPVVMSPMDIVADGDHPVQTTPEGKNWPAIIFGVILLILLFIVLLKFAPGILVFIFEIIVWVVALPFRLLGALFKAIGKKRKEKKQANGETENKPKDKKRQKKEKRKKKSRKSEETDLQKKLDSGENLSRDEIESYLDSIDWNDTLGS